MLEYLALAMLLLSLTALIYIFVFIHDLPHRIAKRRNHPQAEAIHYACWLSLVTLHALWPIVFLWAVSKGREPLSGQTIGGATGSATADRDEADRLRAEVAALEARVRQLEQGRGESSDA